MSVPRGTNPQYEAELHDAVAEFYDDPLGYVHFAWPWGEPGPLENYEGPCPCQVKVLSVLGEEIRKRGFDGKHAVAPIRIAVSSGHGIGKSVLGAMITNFIASTRPNSQGTVTANTSTQLETKTWAAIQHWTRMSVTADLFEISQSRLYRIGQRENWFIGAATCREENSEAFAGQHAADSTSFYLNDEGSAIPDAIFEVEEGGLTDGEPIQLIFGNPTRSTGKFYRVMFGSERSRWRQVQIDSRDCPFTNKRQIEEWISDYGEDSDFVRVRVRGLAPKATDAQFIPADFVYGAQGRTPYALPEDPLIAGVDLAWGGADYNTIRFRRGSDARSIPPIRIPGEQTREPNVLVMRLAEILTTEYDGHKVKMMFIDSAGICGPVAQRLRQLGHENIIEVNFMAHSPDPKYAFMRSCMYGRLKDWLQTGAIDRSTDLEEDLTTPGYELNKKVEIQLETKQKIIDRIGRSTDDGDALALTFAMPVESGEATTESGSRIIPGEYEYTSDSSWMAH